VVGEPAATVHAQLFQLRQDVTRMRPEPDQCGEQFAKSSYPCARGRVIAIVLEGNVIVMIANVGDRSNHKWRERRNWFRVGPQCTSRSGDKIRVASGIKFFEHE
jgi:hypothetical protein